MLTSPTFDRDVGGYVEAIRLAGDNGLMSMLHCEDAATIDHATRRLVERGETALRNQIV